MSNSLQQRTTNRLYANTNNTYSDDIDPSSPAAGITSSSQNNQNSDSDNDEELDKSVAQARIVQQWKEKSKRIHKPGGPIRFKTLFRNTILDVFRNFNSLNNACNNHNNSVNNNNNNNLSSPTITNPSSSCPQWHESLHEVDWDIFWTNKEWIRGIYDKIHLEAHQRVNHFRNFYELTRKDLLVKNLKRARRAMQKKGGGTTATNSTTTSTTSSTVTSSTTNPPSTLPPSLSDDSDHFNFFPDTYSLPAEYSLFVEAFKKSPGISWIMKPIGSSQGKGIFLFEKLSQISEWKQREKWTTSGNQEEAKAEKYIVQRYLSNPLLIGGKKFDLRIYVLVTSYQPLTCYMYRDGFARFSSTRFTMMKGDLTNNYVHLTNVAIQKKGDDYDAESGGKWDVRSLKLYLISKYGTQRVNQLFTDIQLICIRSLLSVSKVIISDKHSFEMYGYDILIDADLKPWLIEVNASPSLSANTPKDYQMKFALLHDTITVVDMERKLTGLEDQIGGYDLIYRGGFVKFNSHCTFTTYLGCHNNREKQMRRMWKQMWKRKEKEKGGEGTAIQPAGSPSNQSSK